MSLYDPDIQDAINALRAKAGMPPIKMMTEAERRAEEHDTRISNTERMITSFLHSLLSVRGSSLKHAVTSVWAWDHTGHLRYEDRRVMTKRFPRMGLFFRAIDCENSERNASAMKSWMQFRSTRKAFTDALVAVGYTIGAARMRTRKVRSTEVPTTRAGRKEFYAKNKKGK